MLTKKQRFTVSEFEKFFRDKKKTRILMPPVTWFIKYRVSQTKVAVVVSKKNIKSAVQRNRLKRQLYEIIRLQLIPGIVEPVEIMCLYQESFKVLETASLLSCLPIITKKNSSNYKKNPL